MHTASLMDWHWQSNAYMYAKVWQVWYDVTKGVYSVYVSGIIRQVRIYLTLPTQATQASNTRNKT